VLIPFIYAISFRTRSLRPVRVPSDQNTRWRLPFKFSTDKRQEFLVSPYLPDKPYIFSWVVNDYRDAAYGRQHFWLVVELMTSRLFLPRIKPLKYGFFFSFSFPARAVPPALPLQILCGCLLQPGSHQRLSQLSKTRTFRTSAPWFRLYWNTNLEWIWLAHFKSTTNLLHHDLLWKNKERCLFFSCSN